MSESIRVLVRVRPFLDNDLDNENAEHERYLEQQESAITIKSDTMMEVESVNAKSKFVCSFDSVVPPQASQQDVYNTVKLCTSSVINGFNSTIFAYGQTGSGKTHTMGTSEGHLSSDLEGISPRALRDIFQHSALLQTGTSRDSVTMQFKIGFIEIYNEGIIS